MKTEPGDIRRPETWDWDRQTFMSTSACNPRLKKFPFVIIQKSAFIVDCPCINVQISAAILLLIFPLQVNNKPHDRVANCAFILELGVVMNKKNLYSVNLSHTFSHICNLYIKLKILGDMPTSSSAVPDRVECYEWGKYRIYEGIIFSLPRRIVRGQQRKAFMKLNFLQTMNC
jgi:hypothetical protein